MSNNIFFNQDNSTEHSESINTKNANIGYTNDTNGNSMFGTMFTQSTSAITGITESVLTPGFRFIKFAIGIMSVFKKLTDNFNTIKSKITRISNIMSAFSTGKHNHIRKSVIKYKIRKG